MDTLFTIILFIAAAIISAFLKKKEAQGNSEDEGDQTFDPTQTSADGPAGQSPPARRLNWEEELRRLLEGETTPQSSAPPPPIIAPRPAQAAPPPVPVARPVVTVPQERVLRPKKTTRPTSILQHSKEAYARASQMHKRTGEKLRQVSTGIQSHSVKPVIAQTNPEVRDALHWLRSPSSLRSAMIASIILGPPKSMDNQ